VPIIFGVDLGQADDFSTVVGVEQAGRVDEWDYGVHLVHRFKLATRYNDVIDGVAGLFDRKQFADAALAVDQTGPGRPVVDLFRQRLRVPIFAVTITAGSGWSADRETGDLRVAKKDLVSTALVLLQNRRLKIASRTEESELLVKELLAFRLKQTASGNETFEAWREGDHDDLVLALAIALWVAEHRPLGPLTDSLEVGGPGDVWKAPRGVWLDDTDDADPHGEGLRWA
jgi:hypothetical protein